jgi:hypothetical protein
VRSSIVDLIAKADIIFRSGLRIFTAGDPKCCQSIDISEAGLEKLVNACPQLHVITLHGTRNLTKPWFATILKGCVDIEAVTITVAKGHISKRTRLGSKTDWLTDRSFVPKLRYLELRGIYFSPDHRNFLDFLTKVRSELEIIYEYDSAAVLIRDMESVPLSRVTTSSGEIE